MGRWRIVLAAVAISCWAAALVILIVSFTGTTDSPREMIELGRVFSYLGWIASVTSLIWALDKWAICPRHAYRLGVEQGERRERQRGEMAQLFRLPGRHEVAARNGHRAP